MLSFGYCDQIQSDRILPFLDRKKCSNNISDCKTITTQITFLVNSVRHDSTWSRQTGRANRFLVPRTRLFGSPDRLQRPDVANHRAHNFVETMRTTHSSRTLFVTFILIITNMIILEKESTLFCWKSFDATLFKEWKQAEYFRRTDFWLMQLQ